MIDRTGLLIMGSLMFIICIVIGGLALCANSISYPEACKDQHQLIITKVPYVEGDQITIHRKNGNTVTYGGLMSNGQFSDTVCSNSEYTVLFKSKDGRMIESTFYSNETDYMFYTDSSGKPDITKGHIPFGETRYRYHYNGTTCNQFGGDGRCSTMSGYCCDGWCGVTINKRCEDIIHGNEVE